MAMCTRIILVSAITLILTGCVQGDEWDSPHYILEVLAVVDHHMYNSLLEVYSIDTEDDMREFILSAFFEVNIEFQSLRKHGLYIEIRVKDVLFPSEAELPWSNHLGPFRKWLRESGNRDFDHAMRLTGKDIRGKKGQAYWNRACTSYGVSIVRFGRNAGSISTMAHEIGHNLGANHDYVSKGCKGNYIMSPGRPVGTRQRWFFSNCSAITMNKCLRNRGPKNCLLHTTTEPIVAKRIGEHLTVENMCDKVGGPRNNASGHAICNVVFCKKGVRINAPEGLPCGPQSKCFMGYCVDV